MKILSKIKKVFAGRHAWIVNTLTGSALFVVGDAIEQKLEKRNGAFNTARSCRIAAIGLFEGPPHYIFYKYLDNYFPGRSKTTIGKKILIDQLVACPMFNLQFFLGMAFLEGKNWDECWKEFVKKFPTVYLVDWMLWPPCQFINFYLIPPTYRVLYVNGVTVLWNIFLSYMKHYDQLELEKKAVNAIKQKEM